MKRLILLLGLCLLLALPLAGTAAQDTSGVQTATLTRFARFFPAETVIFAAVRADADYVAALDGLLTRFARLSDAPPQTLSGALDAVLQAAPGGMSFENDVRPWLGDALTIGILDLTANDGAPLVALAVRNRARAEETLSTLLPSAAVSARGGYTLFTQDSVVALLGDDVLLVGEATQVIGALAGLEGDNLASSTAFNDTLALLPEPAYNIIAYVDTGLIQQTAQNQAQLGGAAVPPALADLLSIGGTQALGFKIFDGLSLTVDAASTLGDTQTLADRDLLPATGQPPVNLALAARVPADAPFVVMDSDFGGDVRLATAAVGLMLEILVEQQALQAQQFGYPDSTPPFLRGLTAGDVRAFVGLTFAGMTGLNLERDVLDKFPGTYVTYARALPDDALQLAPDAALFVEITDPAAAAALFDAVQAALEQYDADFSVDGTVITLPNVLSLLAGGAPVDLLATPVIPALDAQFGYNDAVMALGTRGAVGYTLNPIGAALADDAAFLAAQAYFLPDTETVWYVGTAPLLALLDTLGADAPDAQQTRLLLSQVASASITGFVTDTSASVLRAVLTLTPEAGNS